MTLVISKTNIAAAMGKVANNPSEKVTVERPFSVGVKMPDIFVTYCCAVNRMFA